MIEGLPAPKVGLLEASRQIAQEKQIRDLVNKLNEVIAEVNKLITSP